MTAVGLLVAVDSLYYQELTFTAYNFLIVNVVRRISLFYGHHPFYWYFVCEIPLIFTTFLPLLIHGIAIAGRRVFLYAALWLIELSLLAHKEHRSIYPLVPLLLPYIALGFKKAQDLAYKKGINRIFYFLVAFCVVQNVAMGLYFGSVHQRGVVDVVKWLQVNMEEQANVGFLMPCHSTPYWSELHRPVNMWFLSCEPPVYLIPLITVSILKNIKMRLMNSMPIQQHFLVN